MTFGGFFYTYMMGSWHSTTLYMQLVSFLLIISFSHYLRKFINFHHLFDKKISVKTISTLVIVTFLMALSLKFILSLFMVYAWQMMTWKQYKVSILLSSSLQLWVVIIVWTLFYYIIKIIRRNRQAEIEKWQLQSALKESELLSLKAQLNPHFIFNCLNNIRAIAIDDGDKTRQMITHLSEILKSTFQFNKQKLVPVQQELDYINNYLLLESIQLEERLEYAIDIKTQLDSWEIPPMSIQLLVENAIKHGIMLLEEGGCILIKLFLKKKDLIIEVSNDGNVKNTQTKGIGLENLQKRIKLLLPKGSYFSLNQTPDNKVLAQLVIKP